MITGWYDHETDLFCGDYLAISEYFINGVPVYLGKPYYKHGRSTGTCREHAKTEFKDWLWLTAEITWMIFHIQLPIVPSTTYDRVISKMEDNKKSAQ